MQLLDKESNRSITLYTVLLLMLIIDLAYKGQSKTCR